MSKYGDFEVVRTERRVPKKATDPNADSEGMREYSFLRCPHCKTEIIIASLNLKVQKHATIREHIAICASYTGERPSKRSKEKKESTALVLKTPVAPTDSDESIETRLARIEHENAEIKQENSEMRQEMKGQQNEIKGLQDKTCLYDGVLAAVMPSLALPLTAPADNAKITLRKAAIKDITPSSTALALSGSMDVIPREMHNAILEQKDAMLAVERERREEMKEMHIAALANYKKELEVKDCELSKALQDREVAIRRQRVVELEMREANKTAATASSRAEKLIKERDTLKAKFETELNSNNQFIGGRHGSIQLNKAQQQELKRKIAEQISMDAETAEAVAIEKDYAAKRRREGKE